MGWEHFYCCGVVVTSKLARKKRGCHVCVGLSWCCYNQLIFWSPLLNSVEKEEAIVLVGKFFYHLWFSEETHFVHKSKQPEDDGSGLALVISHRAQPVNPLYVWTRLVLQDLHDYVDCRSYAVFFGNLGMLTRCSYCVWSSFPDSPLLVRAHIFVYQVCCSCSGGGLILSYTSEMRCSILAIRESAPALSTSVLFVLCWIAGRVSLIVFCRAVKLFMISSAQKGSLASHWQHPYCLFPSH